MAEGLQIVITNVSGGVVTVADINDATDHAGYTFQGAPTIAPAASTTIPFTSRVSTSLEHGSLNALLVAGDITVTFTAASRLISAIGGTPTTYTKIAGEDLSAGDLLWLSTAGSVFKATSVSSTGRHQICGICESATLTGNTATILSPIANQSVRFASAPLGSAMGTTVWLGTGGVATLTPPDTPGSSVVRVGILTGPDGVSTTPTVLCGLRHIIDL